MTLDYGLYLVTEESVPLPRLLHTVEEAVRGGVTVVQLREKRSDGRVFFEKAMRLKRLLDAYDIPLIINDRVDVALAVQAAGVHVGQDDLPLPAVRKCVPASMIVGVSARTAAQAQAAERGGANYIGVGAVFPTASKEDAELLPEGMLEVVSQSVSIPVVAIGGLTLNNIPALQSKGVHGFAVVSAIMGTEDPYRAARALRAACDKSKVSF